MATTQNYNMGQVPAINNFPVTNQPINTTQSGISFEQLRNDLANRIMQLAGQDALAMALYQSCIGQNNNWLTGKMDKLVNVLQMTVDFMWRQNPSQDINLTYNQALDEVWSCAWANIGILFPHLQQDPTVQPRIGYVQQWLAISNQRETQFRQAGLLNNNPVQNIPAWQTPSFSQGIPMNTQVTAQQSNGIQMTSTYYNKPPQPTQFNNLSMIGGHMQPQFNQGVSMQSSSNFQTASNFQQPQQQFNAPAYNSNGSQEDRIAAFKRRMAEKKANWTGEVDQWGMPIEGTEGRYANQQPQVQPQQPATVGSKGMPVSVADYVQRTTEQRLQQFDTALGSNTNSMPYANNLNNINQVPEKKSFMPSQPYEIVNQQRMQTDGYNQIEYATERLTPNASTQQPQIDVKQAFRDAGISEEAIQQASKNAIKVDLTDQDQVTALFTKMLQEEDKQKPEGTMGLLPDEVRCLTDKERRKLYQQGAIFEQPYPAPTTANPIHNALHCVLLKNGHVRQIITPLEGDKPMRLPAHHDILAPLRNDPSVKRDPNAGKSISARPVERVSTTGGVVYDRFAMSRKVLTDGIRTALTEEDPVKRDMLVNKALSRFDEQVQKDVFDDLSGRGEFLANNPEFAQDAEDGFPHPIFDDEEKNVERAAIAALLMKVEKVKDVHVVDGGVTDTETLYALEAITNNDPEVNDRAKLATVKQTKVLQTFNNPTDKVLAEEELQDFFWLTEEDSKEDKERLTAAHYADVLKHRYSYIPTFIWEKLNNRLTEYTNDAIRYICGVEGLRIDSFAEDYNDLIKHMAENQCNDPRYPNLPIAISTMDAFLSIQARCLHVTDDFVLMADDTSTDVNIVDKRAITSEEYHRVLNIPATARSYGISGNIVTVNSDAEYGLWSVLKDELTQQLTSRVSRRNYKHPISSIIVAFADGNKYRVFPRIGDQPDYHERVGVADDKEFFANHTLVKMPNYL